MEPTIEVLKKNKHRNAQAEVRKESHEWRFCLGKGAQYVLNHAAMLRMARHRCALLSMPHCPCLLSHPKIYMLVHFIYAYTYVENEEYNAMSMNRHAAYRARLKNEGCFKNKMLHVCGKVMPSSVCSQRR